MSVVGFDIGYQSCYVAIARHGGVEVITNDYSERNSASMVGFTPKQRYMSTSAKTKSMTNVKNTVMGFKNLVGRAYSDPVVQREMKSQHYKMIQLNNDKLGIQVDYLDNQTTFSAEQVMAMMLTYLKGIAENSLGKPVKDCVISVPSFFTDHQRRAMLDASNMAGLNCLRLMNETAAVALAYGIYKQDLPEEKDKSRNVVFVDMGHSSLQVSVCAFNKGKLKVLSKAFDPSLGGKDFDERLVNYFAEEFKKKYKLDALSKSRQTLRLTNECEKLRKLMSMNATPIPLNIECFMNDVDVSGSMKREEFELLCQDLLDRVAKPIQQALAKSGLKLDDIYSVEVVGGCTRIPAVRKIITNIFKRDVSTTLNQDEAVCKGCALQCAILSPTFKVRDFSIQDSTPYPIQLLWKNNGDPGEMEIFKEGDQIYHSKMLTFYRKEPFTLEARYTDLTLPRHQIGTFHIKDVKPTEENESSRIKVKVRLSIHGTFFIKSATLIEKQVQNVPEEMEVEPQSSNSDSSLPGATPTNGTTEGDQPIENTMDSQSSEGTDTGTDTQATEADTHTRPLESETKTEPETDTKSDSASKSKEEVEKTPPAPKKPKTTYKHIDLLIDENTHSLGKKAMDNAFEQECQMIQTDKMEIEKANAKNSVEEYVYEMRDKLETNLQQFINEEDKSVFMQLLNATEEWLYDEGDDQAKKVYVERLEEMKKHGDPVMEREREHSQRNEYFNYLGQTVIHFEKFIEAHSQGDEKYNHIEEADVEKVRELVKKKRDWLNEKMQAQHATPLTANPVVKCSEIKTEAETMGVVCNPIVNKPKPKVEPPKDDQPPAATEDAPTKDEAMDEQAPETTPTNDTPTINPEDMDVD